MTILTIETIITTIRAFGGGCCHWHRGYYRCGHFHVHCHVVAVIVIGFLVVVAVVL